MDLFEYLIFSGILFSSFALGISFQGPKLSLLMTTFSLIYAWIETTLPFSLSSDLMYRVAYIIIYMIASRSLYKWLPWSVEEDIFYWLIRDHSPVSYQFYPVDYGIPISDIISLIIYLFLHKLMGNQLV